jgi:hypothetical protein
MFQLESSLEGMNSVNVLLRRGSAYSCDRATPALPPNRCGGIIVPSSLSRAGGLTNVNLRSFLCIKPLVLFPNIESL